MASRKISPKVQFSQFWKPGSEGLHGNAHVVCPWPKAGNLKVNKLKPGLGHLQRACLRGLLGPNKPNPEVSGWVRKLVKAILGV